MGPFGVRRSPKEDSDLERAEGARPTPPAMTSAPMTPEHLQLLSDRRLQEAADRPLSTSGDADADAHDRALVRMARYEIRRRQCAVPVTDRYSSV